MNIAMSLRQKLEWSRASSQAILSYLASYPVRKLQLGSGINILEGWFNTDLTPSSSGVFFLDATQPFPFDDATFDYIFSEHHIEHLAYKDGQLMLRECHRVLKPGGKIRIATPSLEALLSLYTPTPDDMQQRYMQFITRHFLAGIEHPDPVFVINNAFYNWGHRFLYDQMTLKYAVENVGFVDITFALPGQSDDQQLQAVEKHGQFIGDEAINQFETMVIEGQKYRYA